MSKLLTSREGRNLASISAYLIIPAVGVPMLWSMFQNDDPSRWIASGLLAIFTALFFLHDKVLDRLGSWGCYAYITLQTLIITGLVLLPPGQLIAVVLFFIMSADVTMLFTQRVAAVWIAVFSVITLATYVAVGGTDAVAAVPIYVAGYIFFSTFAQQTARAVEAKSESQRLLNELQKAHRQLQEYAEQAEELAVQEERNRLAREMHDTLGHRLTVSSVQLQAAERLITPDPERARQIVVTVREQISEGLSELRR
ncbi:MAG: histidine kinase, partial [Caldilineales bacterium]